MSNSYIADWLMILHPTTIDLGHSHVMAIVNLTPDSFYAESRNLSYDYISASLRRAIEGGATIVDLGGYSSRPGASDVLVEEEWRRVRMGLESVRSMDEGGVVSIDTFRSEIARRAFEEYGDVIINDISAGEMDEAMVGVVAKNNLRYVAMHMRGTPTSMSSLNSYPEGVVQGVVDYFTKRIKELEAAGIKCENIILDPGFGFAKSVEQNWELMRGLGELHKFGLPLLVGVSRKSMLYKPLGLSAKEVLPASLAMAWEALRQGPAILRVHDVADTRQIVELSNYYNSI
jgi:dihydropteroate synthase